MKRAILDALQRARTNKQQAVLVTELKTGRERLLFPSGKGGEQGDLEVSDEVREAVRRALIDDRSGTVTTDAGPFFIHVYNPPRRLIIVGAVHIAQPLAQMATVSGYEVSLIDPRGFFGSELRFPGFKVIDDWPDEALESLAPDIRTAVVTLTHDPKLDDPALAVALRSGAFYIGALGSRRTHGARLERLTAMGFTAAETSRIHGPIGLDLGGRSPSEIAISVMAQITQVLHREEAA